MGRVKLDVQGAGAALAATFARKGSALRAAAIRVTNDEGLEHYDEVYERTPEVSGRMRRLLRLESTPGGFGYRLGWRAADFRAEGEYPYFFVVLYGSRTVAGDDFLDPINRRRAIAYRAKLSAATKQAAAA